MKRFISNTKAFRRRLISIYVTVIILILKVLPARAALTYDNRNPKDGCGAQLQRILTINALAKFLGLKYIHSEILDISTHALDPFQDENSRKEFVSKLNLTFHLKSDPVEKFIELDISILRVHVLAKYLFKSFFSKNIYLIRVIEPYPIVDYCPIILGFIPEINLTAVERNHSVKNSIVMHYRYGVGGFANYHGRDATRQLNYKYYLDCLSSEELTNIQINRIVMLTDAPLESIKFEPPVEQRSNWIGTPNFDGKFITIQKSDVEEFFAESDFKVECIRGGDPLEAIYMMANANVLIMGKSSLSYVGALLNKRGIIFFPKDFWHTPLRHWITRI
jgi:hypothetical protein